MNRLLTIGAIALAWTSLPALCQRASIDATLHTTDKPDVQALGEATISTKPDQAVVEIGVLSPGSTLAAATSQNAKHIAAHGHKVACARVFGWQFLQVSDLKFNRQVLIFPKY